MHRMADLKTAPTNESVEAFLGTIPDDTRRAECLTVMKILKQVTKAQPRMWGPSIVGFGSYHYKYDSGRAGDWFLTGLSPRKRELTLYIMAGAKRYPALLRKLGKYKTGVSCLYIKQLTDIDLDVLRELVQECVEWVKHRAQPKG
jgi:hypothetical protein